MDYRHGLDELKAQLPAGLHIEFFTLEARLTENLRREQIFGSAESVRVDRARIVDALNRLALDAIGISFNDLARKRTAGARPAAPAPPPQAARPAPQSEGVDLAILIALPEEFRVLIQSLGDSYQHVLDASDGSHTYSFQRASAQRPRPYRCAAKLVGMMGMLNTGLVAQRLLDQLNPATLVMLGIAGGLSDDLGLGDVVIATQADDYLAQSKAVPGSTEQGFTFHLSGEVYRSSAELVRAAQNFEFVYPQQFARWQEAAAAACDRLVPPEARSWLAQEGLLRAHAHFETGHIACGSTVGSAPGFTSWLKQRNRKYLALEMESVGMLAAVYDRVEQRRTLVLRGISDFADERKAQLDRVKGGALRTLAMHNTIQLLWALLEAGMLPSSA